MTRIIIKGVQDQALVNIKRLELMRSISETADMNSVEKGIDEYNGFVH